MKKLPDRPDFRCIKVPLKRIVKDGSLMDEIKDLCNDFGNLYLHSYQFINFYT